MSFGIDVRIPPQEIMAEYERLTHEAQYGLTLTARRKAGVQLRRLAEALRRGGEVGGASVIRSAPALQVNCETAWEEARQAGRAAREQVPPDAVFPQGWVTLVTSDKAFARVLVQRGEPDLSASEDSLRKKSYLHGYGFYIRSATHGVPEQEAFCNAVVSVLKRHGIDVWCHVAWD